MAVDPQARYQTATELLTDLQAATQALEEPVAPLDARHSGRREGWRARSLALAAGVLVLLAAGAATRAWLLPAAPALTDRDSILIGTFENTTGDGVFDETLSEALKVHLGQSPFLDIVPDERIRETLDLMVRPADEPLTSAVMRQVCQRLSVKAMLDGSIAALGSHYVLTLHATDCETGDSLARAQAEATSKERVLTELGTISSTIRTALGESLPSIRQFDVPIEQATTPSLAALKAYTLGLEERRRGRDLESVAFFNQAIALDPGFAAAYTTLSTVYGSLGEWRRGEEYAELAYGVQHRVSERERLFITYQYHDRVTGNQDLAAETLELWKRAYPRDFRPVNALALIYNRMGHFDRAEAEAREALRRSPGHAFPLSNLAFALRALGRYEESRAVAEEAVTLGVATVPTRRLLYQLGVLAGDGSDETYLTWARGRSREFDLISAQAQAAAYHGRLREATELYERASDMALARGLAGIASGNLAHLAWTEALFRPREEAAARVRRTISRLDMETDAATIAPRFRAGVAFGLTGLDAQAQALVSAATGRYPQSTFVQTLVVPTTRAAMALRQGRADDALDILQATATTERGTMAGLVPFYLRAEAYLRQERYPDAIREYERILASRGVDPFAPVVPLAHLGIARAQARAGDIDASRRAYETLFAVWQTADPDLPAATGPHGRVRAPRHLTRATGNVLRSYVPDVRRADVPRAYGRRAADVRCGTVCDVPIHCMTRPRSGR
jgi:eukaryotic-like serine/threonine-protein kinase